MGMPTQSRGVQCPTPWDCKFCNCPDVDTSEPLKCGPCKKCKKRAYDMQSSFINENGEVCRRVTRSQTKAQQDLESQWMPWTGQSYSSLKKQQEKDPDLGKVHKWFTIGTRPVGPEVCTASPTTRQYWNMWDTLEMKSGVLFRRFYKKDCTDSYLQFLVPQSLRKDIMYQLHNTLLSGHLGMKKTREKALQRYYWTGIREDINNWVRKCDVCASNKGPSKAPCAPLGGYRPFHKLGRNLPCT
jgi:hypothetical protein